LPAIQKQPGFPQRRLDGKRSRRTLRVFQDNTFFSSLSAKIFALFADITLYGRIDELDEMVRMAQSSGAVGGSIKTSARPSPEER